MMRRVKNLISFLICAHIFSASGQPSLAESTGEECGSDELNHSILVECNRCQSPSNNVPVSPAASRSDWPTEPSDIAHIHSSRAGERLSKQLLPSLNHKVDADAKLLDINTTLSVKSASMSKSHTMGLGSSLDAAVIASAVEDGSFKKLYGLLFDDLFGTSNSAGAQMSFLRLKLESDFSHDITRLLHELDAQVATVRTSQSDSSQLKIIFHPSKGYPDLTGLANAISQYPTGSSLNLWALVVEHEELIKTDEVRNLHRSLPASCRLLAFVPWSEAPTLLDWTGQNQVVLGGLLVKSQASVPYDVLDYVSSHVNEGFAIIALSRDKAKTKLHGDWSNAHQLAIEILNHFSHGANGFIEEHTISDLNSDSTRYDSSIYSLVDSHVTHFKGPMFYAISHFSRYLMSARHLEYELYTQPNMFSSHFSSFKTDDNQYIVAVVLNGNEHNQPFSWEIDDTIVANILLEPKSFNTFLYKNIPQK